MIVAEPTQAADRLVSAVTDAGGRVDSRSERSGSSSPTVDLVLRIPSDKLDAVLADAKKLGTVESMSIGRSDVTSQRVDLDARIEALQTSVNRLLELMGRAGNIADLLAAESSLTQRQAELDSLRAQRAALGDQISYATINVNLSAIPTVTHGGFVGALQHGWQSLLSALHGVVVDGRIPHPVDTGAGRAGVGCRLGAAPQAFSAKAREGIGEELDETACTTAE